MHTDKRISGHRFQINNGGNQLLYKYFNSPDHSILSMRVRILEKCYHHTNSPTLSTPFSRQREDYWIKILGTAFPYGCNDNIANVGNLTAPQTNNVTVMGLFPHRDRRRRSHGHCTYTRPTIYDVTLYSLLPYVNRKLGHHHIRTKLYSIPLKTLNTLFEQATDSPYLDFSTAEYRLKSMIMDVAHHRLFTVSTPPQITDIFYESCRQYF